MGAQPIRIKITGKGSDEQDDFTPLVSQEREVDDFKPIQSGSLGVTQEKPARKNTLKGQPDKPWTANDVVEAIRPFISGAVGVGTGVAGVAVPIPGATLALGGLGYMGTDLAIKGLQKEFLADEKSELTDQDMIDSGIDAGINEVGGRVIGGLIKGGKGIARYYKEKANPGSLPGVTDDSIFSLQPTFSQAYRKLFGEDKATGRISKWIEDIFFAGEKAAAMENSATLARDQGMELAGRISGQGAANTAKPHLMAQVVKAKARENLAASYAESGLQAATAKNIALQNPQTLVDGRIVHGPINIANTAKLAKEFINEKLSMFPDLVGMPDPDKPLFAAANNIIKNSGAVFDETGALVAINPVSFEDAWALKKRANYFGYGDPLEQQTHTSSIFKDIGESLNQDISDGIGRWVVGKEQAKRAWNFAKATVQQRLEYFGEDGIKQLLHTTNSPLPMLDDIVSDPVKLQRALDSGVLHFPSGKVKVTNMRDILQGNKLNQFIDNAWTPHTTNPTKGKMNVQTVIDDLYKAKNAESYGALFSARNRADIDQFFKSVAHVSEKQLVEGKWIPRVGLWKGAIALSGALMGAGAMGITPYQGGAITLGMATVTGIGLAKLLTNPKTARPLIALAAGQPAGMSDVALGRLIMGALQGAYVTMIDSEGKETQARVSGSQLEPVE